MTVQADNSGAPQQIVTDHITSPVTGDVQVVELGVVTGTTLAVINGANPLPAESPDANAATVTRVADGTTSAALAAANASRKGLIIFNDSTANLYVKFGTGASTASFTYKLMPAQTLEIQVNPLYNGVVHGIWDADTASGGAQVTETS